MVRTLTIDIWGGDWYIETGIEGDDKGYKFPIIGNYKVVDGKITHLHDFMLTDKLIKICRDFGSCFLERCEFVYAPRKNGELNESNKQIFEGDFIDALIFIQHEIERVGYGVKKTS
jgi:hypothetical protein